MFEVHINKSCVIGYKKVSFYNFRLIASANFPNTRSFRLIAFVRHFLFPSFFPRSIFIWAVTKKFARHILFFLFGTNLEKTTHLK